LVVLILKLKLQLPAELLPEEEVEAVGAAEEEVVVAILRELLELLLMKGKRKTMLMLFRMWGFSKLH
jgi:hypothetical protein